jgi:hypothetical protein
MTAEKDLEVMVDVLLSFGRPAYGQDEKLTGVALEWLEARFSPDEAGQWLESSCWEASVARAFADAQLGPEDVATGYSQPGLAHRVCMGDLSIEDAIQAAKKGA